MSGDIEVFTDSHISELCLHPLELAADLGGLEVSVRSTATAHTIEIEVKRRGATHEISLLSAEGKQAEDFISGSGIARIAGAIEEAAGHLHPPASCFGTIGAGLDPEQIRVDGVLISDLLATAGAGADSRRRAARFIGDLAGQALARLLNRLHDGRARKASGFPDWSEAEMNRLRGVSRFVLGGGITKTPLGQHMIAHARHTHSSWEGLVILETGQLADEAGALGAFSLIPLSEL